MTFSEKCFSFEILFLRVAWKIAVYYILIQNKMLSIKTAVDTLVLWKIFVSKTKKILNFLGKMDNFQLGTISDWN